MNRGVQNPIEPEQSAPWIVFVLVVASLLDLDDSVYALRRRRAGRKLREVARRADEGRGTQLSILSALAYSFVH